MAAPRKYSVELQQRATRMALDARKDPESARGAIKRVADQLGVHPEALRTWDGQAEIDGGIRPGTTTDDTTRLAERRAIRDAELITDIRTAHQANLGVYGARKIHAELNREGLKVARCTVERLMKADGLRGIPREKTRKTTIGDGAETARPEDLVERKGLLHGSVTRSPGP